MQSRNIHSWASFALGFSSFISIVSHGAIYGDDNRIDLYEAPPAIQALARSSVALVKNTGLEWMGDHYRFRFQKDTYGRVMNLKYITDFSHQPTYAHCSGTLVAPQLVLTAKHCIQYIPATQTAFVFDYKMTSETEIPTEASADQVYFGKGIIKDWVVRDDLMLVILDRPVLGRAPVKFAQNPKATEPGTPLFTIHYPTGMPAKYSNDAILGGTKITEDEYQYVGFWHNLDTFGGSSGAPIFNENTGEMIGVLTQGERDFKRSFLAFSEFAPLHEVRYRKFSKKKSEFGAFLTEAIVKHIQDFGK